MNAIENNEFRRGWRDVAARLPRPRAILCISAHWETDGVAVTSGERPETIHDFYGFPPELFEVKYPAPGDPTLAQHIAALFPDFEVKLDRRRGLDHGAWSVLSAMYPEADVPVVQLSLDRTRPTSFHYALGRRLAPLRAEGVLVVGSGNIVHNLGLIDFHKADGFDWADRFNKQVKARIQDRDHEALINYRALGRDAELSVPTPEHYLPLLYALALQGRDETAVFFNDRVTMGAVSMTCITIGGSHE